MAEINWKQVKNERRLRIVNVNLLAIEQYILIKRNIDSSIHFMDEYDLPEKWMLLEVAYSPEHNSFMFIICSPEFSSVDSTRLIPFLEDVKCMVKITREVIYDK